MEIIYDEAKKGLAVSEFDLFSFSTLIHSFTSSRFFFLASFSLLQKMGRTSRHGSIIDEGTIKTPIP
jgi:hypothetical protein